MVGLEYVLGDPALHDESLQPRDREITDTLLRKNTGACRSHSEVDAGQTGDLLLGVLGDQESIVSLEHWSHVVLLSVIVASGRRS